MADSTLMRTGETPPDTHKGHGTSALGPSDSSDSGSDIRGGPGLVHDVGIGLAQGTTSGPDLAREPHTGAGADLGDADLDSDTDRFGTGERGAAGRDATTPTDAALYDDRGVQVDGEDIADVSALDLGPGDGDGDDVDLDTTLEEGESDDDADLDTTLDNEGEDVEREAPTGRANGKPAADDDVPVFDRAWRDDRQGM